MEYLLIIEEKLSKLLLLIKVEEIFKILFLINTKKNIFLKLRKLIKDISKGRINGNYHLLEIIGVQIQVRKGWKTIKGN